jgi:hypothetical protein
LRECSLASDADLEAVLNGEEAVGLRERQTIYAIDMLPIDTLLMR